MKLPRRCFGSRIIILLLCPVLAFATPPNAVNTKRMATESVVAELVACGDAAKKRLSESMPKGERLDLTALAYCSCMTDALMAFPAYEALSKADTCTELAKKKASEIISTGKNVEFKNIFSPGSMTSARIQYWFALCFKQPKGNFSTSEWSLWCSCLIDHIRELPTSSHTISALGTLMESKTTECGDYADRVKTLNSTKKIK